MIIFKAGLQEVILTKENGKERFIDLTHKFKAGHQEVTGLYLRIIFKAGLQEVILTKENEKERFIDLTHKFKAGHQEVILT